MSELKINEQALVVSRFDGFRALLGKEVRRFAKVWIQTVITPVVTAFLYLMVFAHVLEGRDAGFSGISYLAFLVPGLAMMSIMQNAFANASSSLIQSKMNGSLVFLLLAPLSAFEIWAAFVLAAMLRGLMVGAVLLAVALLFVTPTIANPLLILAFALLGGGILGGLGMIAGILAEKFDHMSAFQNFIILPLSFLAGVFYSIGSLPPLWETVSRFNPLFYLVDGFRRGFVGIGDVPLAHSLIFTGIAFGVVSLISWRLLATGYRIRS